MAELFQWQPFDTASYETVYQLQKQLVEQRVRGETLDTLLLGEHPHVITMGRGSHLENIVQNTAVPVAEIERGGDVTYHGPGQLVGYPIFQLQEGERDLHRYLRNLEEVLIRVLKHFDIEGRRNQGWTGVWVGDYKIASIGVAVRKWVAYHGFALNISTDLSYFGLINPCGLPSAVMTSIAALLPDASPNTYAMPIVQNRVIHEIAEVFGRTLVPLSPESAFDGV